MNPFGLFVQWGMAEHDGGRTGEGVCIGQMDYGDDIWCIADEKSIGMPINREWCSYKGTVRQDELAKVLRARYVKEFGQRFKPVEGLEEIMGIIRNEHEKESHCTINIGENTRQREFEEHLSNLAREWHYRTGAALDSIMFRWEFAQGNDVGLLIECSTDYKRRSKSTQ